MVKQQENVDIQRKLPLLMYIGKRGDKKSVMNHFYYTIDPYLLDYFKETSDTTLLRLQRQVSANDNPIVVRVSMKSE